jgi:hypothetical protein
MVSRLEARLADIPRAGSGGVAIPAGLDPVGIDVLLESGKVDPMAFRASLNLNRTVLVVAVRAPSRHGNVPGMVEPDRLVDPGQAAQEEILRNLRSRGRTARGANPEP